LSNQCCAAWIDNRNPLHPSLGTLVRLLFFLAFPYLCKQKPLIVENRGQVADEALFYVKGTRKTVYFRRDGVTFVLTDKPNDKRAAVSLDFVGADRDVNPRGEDRQPTTFSYFRGKPEEWLTAIPTYAKLIYHDLWPGIDLVFDRSINRLKYAFLVSPEANPQKIKLAWRGAEDVKIEPNGAMLVETIAGRVEDATPTAYQELEGEHIDVEMVYQPEPNDSKTEFVFRFHIGDYDPQHPLILDPAVLIYCGYIGGASNDSGEAIAVDAAGCAYVTGITDSNEMSFPIALGPGLTHSGFNDAFVAKIPPRHLLARSGNVNVRNSPSADVLYINNSTGDNMRKLTITASTPVTIFIDLSPSGPFMAPFVLYMWFGEAGPNDLTEQPYNIGWSCFPMPLSNGSPQPPPRTIVNNYGYEFMLGYPMLNNILPAPVTVGPGYLSPGTYTFQGLIDGYASSGPGLSLTNAIVVEVQ